MKILIVYYSRTGNTRKVANELAQQLSADIEEISEPVSRKGIIGWLLAGRDACFKKNTPIADIKHNVADYDLVIIGTPIWAYTMASPIRHFLQKHKTDIKRVAFFVTMGGSGDKRTFSHMQELLGLAPTATASFIDSQIRKDNFKDGLSSFTASIKQNL